MHDDKSNPYEMEIERITREELVVGKIWKYGQ